MKEVALKTRKTVFIENNKMDLKILRKDWFSINFQKLKFFRKSHFAQKNIRQPFMFAKRYTTAKNQGDTSV